MKKSKKTKKRYKKKTVKRRTTKKKIKRVRKPINLKKIQNSTKKIYEMSSEISLLQEELDDMLTVINKNSVDYKRGKISKSFFDSNEKRLRVKSVKIIKNINGLVDSSSKLNSSIEKETKSQKL